MRVKRIKGCPCQGAEGRSYSTLFTNKYPVTPELKYLTAKMAALTPFGKTADFLAELLPSSSRVSTGTARNRTIKVGKRLQKSAESLANKSALPTSSAAVVGFDGGYVRARHRQPERNFEIVVGKVLNQDDQAVRFAFVRRGSSEAATAVDRALRSCGVDEKTSLTVLTDGDAGLRAIHQQIAPKAEHILDWFHAAVRFQNLGQIAKGINELNDGLIRRHALDELLETIRYLELNSDSMPNYGSRYRKGTRISTGFAESAVNEVIAKRMAKRQQMAWNRHTVQPFLEVRVHVLDDTLEDAFRHWHRILTQAGMLGSFGLGVIAPQLCMLSVQTFSQPLHERKGGLQCAQKRRGSLDQSRTVARWSPLASRLMHVDVSSGSDLEQTLIVLKPVTATQPDTAGIRMKWIEEEVM